MKIKKLYKEVGVMIKEIVKNLIKACGTSNPFILCDYLHIKIIKSNLGAEVKGFFQRTPTGYKIIHINSNINENEMKYICAHELGHAILHTDMSIGFFIENTLLVKNKYEIEADKFAAELLIDIETNNCLYKDITIKQLSSIFHVPVDLIKYKYHFLWIFFISNSLILTYHKLKYYILQINCSLCQVLVGNLFFKKFHYKFS